MRERLARGLRAGLAAGSVAGWLAGIVAALLVTVPPGVLRESSVPDACLAVYWCALLAVLGGAVGLLLGLPLALVRRPLPDALALALAATVALPAALVVNVRHLPRLAAPVSVAANVAMIALALVVALLLRFVFRSLLHERQAPPARALAAAVAAAMLPAALASLAARAPAAVSAASRVVSRSGLYPTRRPRTLLLVTIDALRADHLGCYGYARPTSPAIDALAAAGVVYDRFIAPAPNTHPSLAAMMTGRSLVAFDHLASRDFLPRGARTVAAEMKALGYRTAAVVSNPHLKHEMGFGQGFDRFDDDSAMVKGAREVTDAALRAADGQGEEGTPGPLFLWVHYLDPHHPYAPPPPWDTKFSPRIERVDAMQRQGDLSELLVGAARGRVPFTEAEWTRLEALYDGEIAYADAELARLLEGLRARHRLDDALVVVTADHGEEFREHGGVLHGHTLFRELVRLPLVVWRADPPEPAGSTTAPPPHGVRDAHLVAATSLRTLLAGGALAPAARVLSEKLHEVPGLTPPLVALRTERLTLIVPALRPYAYGLDRRRIAATLRELALFLPVALDHELYAADDVAEKKDLARTDAAALAEMERLLRAEYRTEVMARGSTAAPGAETLEQLKGLGYVNE